MKTYTLIFFFAFLLSFGMKGLTVKSITQGAWTNPQIWSNGLVPSAPDTILLKHYITFSNNLIISSPTILFIESTGTLCGNFKLEIGCGATWYNYGAVYLNGFLIRGVAYNYCSLKSTSSGTLVGCPGSNNGGFMGNYPPNGSTSVGFSGPCPGWDETGNSQGGCNAVALQEQFSELKLLIFPNPFTDKVTVEFSEARECVWTIKTSEGILINDSGKCFFKKKELDLSILRPGLYFIQIKTQENTFIKKLIKNY